jgi:hypothetical protein
MYARRRSFALPWLLSCLWLVVVLTACASSPPRPAATTPVSKGTATVVAGAPHCQPASPITTSAIGMPEVRGTTNGKTELWALLFNTLVAKQELKIVWRMTGDGDLQVVAQGPRNTSIKPKWIEPHGGSNWPRPGAEWGTGFILPTPGCWNFHANRKDASGDVWLMVK